MENVNPVLLQKVVDHTIGTDKTVADKVFSDKYLIIKSLGDPFKEQFKEQLGLKNAHSSGVVKNFSNAIISRKEAVNKILLTLRNKDSGGTVSPQRNRNKPFPYMKNYSFSRKTLSKNDESIVMRFAKTEESVRYNTLITLYCSLNSILPLSIEQYTMLSPETIHMIFYRSSFIARIYKIVVAHIQKPVSFLLHHIRAFFTYFFGLHYDAQKVLLRLPLLFAMQLVVEIDTEYYTMLSSYAYVVFRGNAIIKKDIHVLNTLRTVDSIPVNTHDGVNTSVLSFQFLDLVDKAAMQYPLEFITYVRKNLPK